MLKQAWSYIRTDRRAARFLAFVFIAYMVIASFFMDRDLNPEPWTFWDRLSGVALILFIALCGYEWGLKHGKEEVMDRIVYGDDRAR